MIATEQTLLAQPLEARAPSAGLGLEVVLIGCRFEVMPRHILTDEADRLARQVAEQTGESLDDVVERALRAEADRTQPPLMTKPRTPEEKLALIAEIQARVAALPILDPRDPDEILYDEDGLPK
ncbi:type II toxin-antitoxin system VapB family antitoxin [Caulobacter sp. BK020]|uniref:type II toxin-antitoxin system VapB family antitoxin n=1 Tax=Caulobacter sp. BK020 TaxID=2512117 RepID=UPI001052AB88|nr:type II toxin-antitoxin system VapB family antitoxin [Caulobacter sp. BK020]